MFGTSRADIEYKKVFETKKIPSIQSLKKQLVSLVLNQEKKKNKADQARNAWIRNNWASSAESKIAEVFANSFGGNWENKSLKHFICNLYRKLRIYFLKKRVQMDQTKEHLPGCYDHLKTRDSRILRRPSPTASPPYSSWGNFPFPASTTSSCWYKAFPRASC